MPEQPKTLQEVIRHYSDPETCIQAVAAARWPKGVECPACEGKEHYYLKTRHIWKCRECGRQFSLKVGTMFEDSPIPLEKWLTAIWLIASCKNGIRLTKCGAHFGVTQKTAWFMMHRIRLAMQDKSFIRMPQRMELQSRWMKPSSAAKRAICTRIGEQEWVWVTVGWRQGKDYRDWHVTAWRQGEGTSHS